MSLKVNGIESVNATDIPPKQTGVYCFLSHKTKTIFANVTSDIEKGRISHEAKGKRQAHSQRKFLEAYPQGLEFTAFPTNTWEEAVDILNALNEDKQYSVIRL